MTEPHLRLQRNADELLRELPVSEPDFEAQAKAIEARLSAALTASPISSDALLAPPDLSAEAQEPPLPSQVRAAPKNNFAEMARRSLHKPDDEAAALAKELLAATAQRRRPNAELVERMRAAGKSAPTSTPLPESEPRSPRNSGVVPRSEAIAAGATPKAAHGAPARDRRGLFIALGGIALAAAAAFALFGSGSGPLTPPVADAVQATRSPPVAPAAEPARPPAARAAAPTDEGVVTPDALPAAAASESKPGSVRGAKPSVLALAPSKAAAASAASAPAPVVLPDDPAPLAASSPKAQPAEAPEPPLRPAQGYTGSVPLNPSAGAVSTALGSVRSGAQACLAGQTDPVTATVTFASDGHVSRVSAAGPSASCLQAALGRAQITPFAKESFSVTTTIRPP